MAVRGKGRGEIKCLAFNTPDRVHKHDKETKDEPKFRFMYKDYAEYKDEKTFFEDLSYVLESQMLVVQSGVYEHMKNSVWKYDEVASTMGTLEPKDFCNLCDTRDIGCAIELSFCTVKEIHMELKNISKCPRCGTRMGPYMVIPERDFKLHDVRLAGYPVILKVKVRQEWTCSTCHSRISSVRIPALQGKKRGQFTLRLLQSILEKKVEGRPASEIAEAYGIRLNTVNALMKEYRSYIEEWYRYESNIYISSIEDMRIERIRLKGENFWAVIDTDRNELITILPYDVSRQVDAILKNIQPLKASDDLPIALNCTLAPLAPIRRFLAVGLLEIAQKSMVNGLDKLNCDIRALTEKVIFSHDLTTQYLQDWLLKYNAQNMDGIGQTEWSLRQELNDTVEKAIREGANGYGDAYRINNNKYRNTQQSLEHFLWNREAPWHPQGQYDQVLSQLEQAALASGLRVTEQIERVLWFNEFSLYSARVGGIEMGVDGLPNRDGISQLGWGIPLECLSYLLTAGLLDKGAHSIQCVKHRHGRARQSEQGCQCANCPLVNEY